MIIEWLKANAVEICGIVTAIAAALGSVFACLTSARTSKRAKKDCNELDNKVQMTREGFVKAFQETKFPTNFKIDLSNKVDKVLTENFAKFKAETLGYIEDYRKLLIFVSKILYNTAAYNKLTDEEKAELDNLIVAHTDITIE